MKPKNISKSAKEIRSMIDAAIDTGKISRDDYDKIINLTTEDNVIDEQERVILAHLNDLIYSKDIKITK